MTMQVISAVAEFERDLLLERNMGFVLIAIYTGSQLAYQGAVIQMIAHGLSAAGLFILPGRNLSRPASYALPGSLPEKHLSDPAEPATRR